MTNKTVNDWIDEIKEPYLKVVGEAIHTDQEENRPPIPLKTLANTQTGSQEGLLELYRALDKCESRFEEPPDWVDMGRAADRFDNISEIRTRKDYPNKPEQQEKWFQYGKIRVLGALKKSTGEIPDADVIKKDWIEIPEKEIQILLLLDKNAALNTEDPELLAKELKEDDELGEFKQEKYDQDRDLRQEIQSLDRPGVKYGLLEAYKHRIETLNEVFTSIIQGTGVDSITNLDEAKKDVQDTREDVEKDVASAFQKQVVPHLEALESQFESLANNDTEVENSEIQAQIDNRVTELREDIQDWSITEAGDLESEIAKLQQLRREMRRAFVDERMKASDALIEMNNELDALDEELETVADQIENKIQDSYEDVIGAQVKGESFDAEQPVMEELARMLLLLSRLNGELENQ